MAKAPEKKSSGKGNVAEDDPFIAEVIKRVSSVVGRERAAQVATQIIALYQEERFSGPIAHPKHLREYEEIVPGSADRIIFRLRRPWSIG